MKDGESNQRLVVILTALGLEREAVCAFLTDVKAVPVNKYGRSYWRGTFSGKYTWDVVVAESGPGGFAAFSATNNALDDHKPDIIFFIGVAGGRKDVKHGDVVVASKVYAYEVGKADENFLSRPSVKEPPYSLIQKAQAVIRNKEWLKRLPDAVTFSPPEAYLGAIAAGESVVTSLSSEIAQRLNVHFNDTLALDMEGHGFLEAIYRQKSPVDALVVRGISDLLNDKHTSNDNQRQLIAARNASAFAFEMLATHDYEDAPEVEPSASSDPQAETPSDKTENPPPEQPTTSISELSPDMQTIMIGLHDYKLEMIQLRKIFDGNHDVFPARCRYTISQLIAFQNFMNGFSFTSNIVMKLQMDDLLAQTERLINELSELRKMLRASRHSKEYHDRCRNSYIKFTDILRSLDNILIFI
jgi:nucleoside phosphorylase